VKQWISAAVVLPVLTAACLVSVASPADAATHPVAGTYQWFVQGNAAQTVVLLSNHTVQAPNSGTWAVSRHVITVQMQGAPAGAFECQKYGQPPGCTYGTVSTGPRTSTGIASSSTPGTWTGTIGSVDLVTEPFYAVRTGPAK
jgi:hypothetical protein